jgi:protein-disulfide isomerase
LTKFDEFDCALKLLATGVVLMKRYLPLIIAGAAALTALASGRLLCQTIQPPRLTISEDGTTSATDSVSMHIRGNPEAAVTLEEFVDFECPNCAALAAFLDQLIKEYDPRVRLIFRNFPLPMHQFARDAAVAAEAAGLQGRYWEMHDMLFREQAVWSSATDPGLLFDTYAETLGLDLNRFRKDVKSDKVRERLESDQARARSLSVKTAPTLFVDKREMGPNDRTPEGVRRLVDEAVTAKTSPSEKK